MHYTSTDNHASRMTVVISGQFPSTQFMAIFAATQCSTVTTRDWRACCGPREAPALRPNCRISPVKGIWTVLVRPKEVSTKNQTGRELVTQGSRCRTLQETGEVLAPRRIRLADEGSYSPKVRSTPVAIHRPRAPLGLNMRTRNKGLAHAPKVPRLPLNCAFQCASRFTPGVSWVDSASAPGLHTRVPSTFVMGPGVPLNWAPLMTSCWMLNEAAPVDRFTRAVPPRTVQANVPL